jgi:hypothetical protein
MGWSMRCGKRVGLFISIALWTYSEAFAQSPPIPYPAGSLIFSWTYSCPANVFCVTNGLGISNQNGGLKSAAINLVNIGSDTQPIPLYIANFEFTNPATTPIISFNQGTQISFNNTLTLAGTQLYPPNSSGEEWDFVCQSASGCSFSASGNTTSGAFTSAKVILINLVVGSLTIPTYMMWTQAINSPELFVFNQSNQFAFSTNMVINKFCQFTPNSICEPTPVNK